MSPSITRITTRSTRGKNPAARPSTLPTSVTPTITDRPMVSERRAP